MIKIFQHFSYHITGSIVLEKFTVAEINLNHQMVGNHPNRPITCEKHSSVQVVLRKSAEVVFIIFGSGNTGGIQANVDRWMKQLRNHLAKK